MSLCTFELMQRVFSIVLLCVVLMGQTEFHQFLKVPTMLEHFLEHREHQPHLGFAEFISIHYGSAANGQDDHASRDAQLPFKNALSSSFSIAATKPEASLDLSAVFVPEQCSVIVSYVAHLPSGRTADIWQPPRQC